MVSTPADHFISNVPPCKLPKLGLEDYDLFKSTPRDYEIVELGANLHFITIGDAQPSMDWFAVVARCRYVEQKQELARGHASGLHGNEIVAAVGIDSQMRWRYIFMGQDYIVRASRTNLANGLGNSMLIG